MKNKTRLVLTEKKKRGPQLAAPGLSKAARAQERNPTLCGGLLTHISRALELRHSGARLKRKASFYRMKFRKYKDEANIYLFVYPATVEMNRNEPLNIERQKCPMPETVAFQVLPSSCLF